MPQLMMASMWHKLLCYPNKTDHNLANPCNTSNINIWTKNFSPPVQYCYCHANCEKWYHLLHSARCCILAFRIQCELMLWFAKLGTNSLPLLLPSLIISVLHVPCLCRDLSEACLALLFPCHLPLRAVSQLGLSFTCLNPNQVQFLQY